MFSQSSLHMEHPTNEEAFIDRLTQCWIYQTIRVQACKFSQRKYHYQRNNTETILPKFLLDMGLDPTKAFKDLNKLQEKYSKPGYEGDQRVIFCKNCRDSIK